MTTKTVALVSIFALTLLAYMRADANNAANLMPALQGLRSSGQPPVLVAAPNISLVPSTEPIPENVQATFNQIQKYVYGQDTLITLRACDGCQAIADANTMSVYLEPKFLKTLVSRFGADSRNIIAFVVAHEISHFTYEYITLSSRNKLSPNGNIPLLTKSFIDFVDLTKFITMIPREQRTETSKYLAIASRAHSEVDMLGLLTLKAMRQQVSADAIKYLQAEVALRTHQERAQSDFDLRLKNISEAIANGDL
jgi:hypothetical protein